MDAGHGAEALESVRVALPDLVVTDIMMPVMDGVELIRRLRTDPATATILILAASSHSHLADGADAILSKPYVPDQLIAAARALLAKKAEQS
jgi:two-component system chemotaxis response regulator CheY